jgi:hypothetical protein
MLLPLVNSKIKDEPAVIAPPVVLYPVTKSAAAVEIETSVRVSSRSLPYVSKNFIFEYLSPVYIGRKLLQLSPQLLS